MRQVDQEWFEGLMDRERKAHAEKMEHFYETFMRHRELTAGDRLNKCRDHIKWLLSPEVNRSIDGADLQDVLNIIEE